MNYKFLVFLILCFALSSSASVAKLPAYHLLFQSAMLKVKQENFRWRASGTRWLS